MPELPDQVGCRIQLTDRSFINKNFLTDSAFINKIKLTDRSFINKMEPAANILH